jgi:hypothetical protein
MVTRWPREVRRSAMRRAGAESSPAREMKKWSDGIGRS